MVNFEELGQVFFGVCFQKRLLFNLGLGLNRVWSYLYCRSMWLCVLLRVFRDGVFYCFDSFFDFWFVSGCWLMAVVEWDFVLPRMTFFDVLARFSDTCVCFYADRYFYMVVSYLLPSCTSL